MRTVRHAGNSVQKFGTQRHNIMRGSIVGWPGPLFGVVAIGACRSKNCPATGLRLGTDLFGFSVAKAGGTDCPVPVRGSGGRHSANKKKKRRGLKPTHRHCASQPVCRLLSFRPRAPWAHAPPNAPVLCVCVCVCASVPPPFPPSFTRLDAAVPHLIIACVTIPLATSAALVSSPTQYISSLSSISAVPMASRTCHSQLRAKSSMP